MDGARRAVANPGDASAMVLPAHRRPGRNPGRVELPSYPLPRADAVALGWSVEAQRHGVTVRDLVRPRRGVVARRLPRDGDIPWWQAQREGLLAAGQAAVASCPRAVLSHAPAAVALGLPTSRLPDLPCITVPAGTALRRIEQAHLHRATLTSDDVVTVGRDSVTAPARTVLDIAREHGVEPGVIAADYALHEGVITRGDLAAAFEQAAHWPGRKAARITLLFADSAAESVLESRSRLRMAACGLPTPRLQVDICDEYGRFLGRPDFYWDEFGVIGEADGNLKYEGGRDAIISERGRQAQFEDTGLIVVRWGWGATRDFTPTAQRLRVAFDRGEPVGSARRRWGVLVPRTSGLHSPAGIPAADRIR